MNLFVRDINYEFDVIFWYSSKSNDFKTTRRFVVVAVNNKKSCFAFSVNAKQQQFNLSYIIEFYYFNSLNAFDSIIVVVASLSQYLDW